MDLFSTLEFEPPPNAPESHAGERVCVNSREYRAYQQGFHEGAANQTKIANFDPDARVTRYYEDGYRIGRLFRPLPCMKDRPREERRRWR